MLDSLLGQLNSERLHLFAGYLDESTEKVYATSRSYFATLLGSLISKGNDIGLENTLKQSSNLHSNDNSQQERIFSGSLNEAERQNAQKIIDTVFAEKTIVLQSRLASTEGMSPEAASKLMLILTAILGGFAGNKMKSENISLRDFTSKIYDERAHLNSSLPGGFSTLFGLGALSAVGGIPFHEGVTLHYLNNEHKPTIEEEEKESRNRQWVGYLILFLVLLLMAYFVKSCKTCNESKGQVEIIKIGIDTVKPFMVAASATHIKRILLTV